MKNFILGLILIFFMAKIYLYSADSVNLADYYLYPYKENGSKNFFHFFYQNLKEKHGIKVFIYKDTEKKSDIEGKAKQKLNELKIQNEEKILLIFINSYFKKGRILVEDDLADIFEKRNIEILEKEILNKFTGRWYINELSIYTKIAGTFFYLLEKENLDKDVIEKIKNEMIRIDDFLFVLAMKPPFSHILNFFYFEPISFILYFPFITYFIFIRIIGYNLGLTGFRISNIIWFIFIFFTGVLIYNKMNIILPEYVNLFLMFCGLSTPIYIYLYFIYKEEIHCALYGYFNKITGGFNENIFQND